LSIEEITLSIEEIIKLRPSLAAKKSKIYVFLNTCLDNKYLSFREYILQFTEKEVRAEVFNKAKKSFRRYFSF
jgi:hypothetical protein